jgi:hypothetical protein
VGVIGIKPYHLPWDFLFEDPGANSTVPVGERRRHLPRRRVELTQQSGFQPTVDAIGFRPVVIQSNKFLKKQKFLIQFVGVHVTILGCELLQHLFQTS